MDYSLPGSSIHGIFQARIPEWVVISFSRRSSQPRDWTWVFHIVGRRFIIWATRNVSKITDVEIKLRMYWKIPHLNEEISKKKKNEHNSWVRETDSELEAEIFKLMKEAAQELVDAYRKKE